MIQTYAHQKELHESRLEIKTLEQLFANLITDGTNCSPFKSEIIVGIAKEVFAIGDHSEGNILQPGQMIWTAIDMNEPPGKPLKHCKLKRIIITHINPKTLIVSCLFSSVKNSSYIFLSDPHQQS